MAPCCARLKLSNCLYSSRGVRSRSREAVALPCQREYFPFVVGFRSYGIVLTLNPSVGHTVVRVVRLIATRATRRHLGTGILASRSLGLLSAGAGESVFLERSACVFECLQNEKSTSCVLFPRRAEGIQANRVYHLTICFCGYERGDIFKARVASEFCPGR